MATSPNHSPRTSPSFDQQALLVGNTADDAATRLLIAAASEDMATLAAMLPTAAHDSIYHFARAVFHTKDRIPNRAALLPQIEADIQAAATGQPTLLLAKIRYLHLVLSRGQDAAALMQDIMSFPLTARDAELLSIILHAGGKTAESIALLSKVLQQIAEPEDMRVIGHALGWYLTHTRNAAMAAQLHQMVPHLDSATLNAWRQPVVSTGDKATIIIPTNIGGKFKYNQASAPPSGAMLRQTLESLYTQLQAPKDWPVVIYFDEPRDAAMAPQADAYRDELKTIAREYNAQLDCRAGHGLRRNFIEAVTNCETPYYFFLEHDWTFSFDAPPLPVLMQTMQAHADVNVIRYNYNYNHLQRHDYALVPFATTTGLPLLTGTYYCNNPALVRTGKMQRDWLPLLTDTSLDNHNAGAGGVEETIYLHMLRLVKECGIIPVMQAMGCTVIGTAGNTPRAIHNGI